MRAYDEWLAREGPRPDRADVRMRSDRELLTILFRSPMAADALLGAGPLPALASSTVTELTAFPGVSRIAAERFRIAVEIGRRAGGPHPARTRPRVLAASDVHEVVASRFTGLPHEEAHVVLLDGRAGVIGVEQVSRGGTASTPVDPGQVFGVALRARAVAVVVVHNHPSGDLEPSAADLDLTDRLAQAGAIVNVPLRDHVIVAGDRYVSLQERGHIHPMDPADLLKPRPF